MFRNNAEIISTIVSKRENVFKNSEMKMFKVKQTFLSTRVTGGKKLINNGIQN